MRMLREFAVKNGFEMEGDIDKSPENSDFLKVIITKRIRINNVNNEFSVSFRLVNWRRKIERYGMRRDFREHDYELQVVGNVTGYENWWFSRVYRGNNPDDLFGKAVKYVEEQYSKWLKWLGRRGYKQPGIEEEKPKHGLWKWSLLVPAVAVSLYAITGRQR